MKDMSRTGMEDKGGNALITIGSIALAIAVFTAGPFILMWAASVFGLSVDYGWEQWLASLMIVWILRGGK